jgi:hypothetical protein
VYDTSTDDVSTGLRIPVQSVPIERGPAGEAAFRNESGVDASFDWGGLAETLIPLATKFI